MRSLRQCVLVMILLVVPTLTLHGAGIDELPPITPQNIDHITVFAELYGEQPAQRWSLVFSPDGRWIVSGDEDFTQVWEANTGKRSYSVTGPQGYFYDFSADGSVLVVGSNAFLVANIDLRQEQFRQDIGDYATFRVSPDGSEIAYSVANVLEGYKIRIITAQTGELLREIAYRDTDRESLGMPAYNADGSLLAVSYDTLDRDVCLDEACEEILELGVIIFDAVSGQDLAIFNAENSRVRGIAFIPNSTLLAVTVDTETYLWDYVAGETVATAAHPLLNPDDDPISTSMTLNQAGTILAIAHENLSKTQTSLQFFDISTPENGTSRLTDLRVEGGIDKRAIGFGADDRLFGIVSDTTGLLRLYGILNETACVAWPAGEFANLRLGPAGYFSAPGRLNVGERALVTGHTVDARYEYWQLYGDTWVRADVVQISGNCDSLKVPDDVCKISPPVGGSANLRIGPATGFPQAASMVTDDVHVAIGRTSDSDGFTWWQINGDLWVREDVVQETGTCDSVPEVSR